MLSIIPGEDQSDWEGHIDDIVYAMITVKRTVKEFTPHFLLFGSETCEVVDNFMLKLEDPDALTLSMHLRTMLERKARAYEIGSVNRDRAALNATLRHDVNVRVPQYDVGQRCIYECMLQQSEVSQRNCFIAGKLEQLFARKKGVINTLSNYATPIRYAPT